LNYTPLALMFDEELTGRGEGGTKIVREKIPT